MKKALCVVAAALALSMSGSASAAGTVAGAVTFKGAAPERKPIRNDMDPFCKQTKTFDDAVLVGGKGGLQNVVVRIAGGVEGEHKAPTTPLVIDQKGCTYQPRVAAVMAGQPVQIRNGDMTLHNVHTYFGKETVFNRAMPNDRVPPITWDSGKDERALNAVMKLKCDVHPWMIGYVSVSKHPWFQVTGADGAFKLQNVPPGKYTLEAWHEKLGVKTQEITVEDGKTAKVEFSFDGA